VKPVEPFLRAALKTAWIALRPGQGAEPLLPLLAEEGWQVTHCSDSVPTLLRELAIVPQAPDLLITGLHLADGDALELSRMLPALREPPAVFFLSRQQRSVVKSAKALARTLGLVVAGSADFPFDPAEAMNQIRSNVRQRGLQAMRARPVPPLSRDEVSRLFQDGGIRAYLQPKLRARSGEVVGFESLMRGVARDATVVAPSRLLEPLAEAGLLAPATLQIVEQTAEFLREGLCAGMPVSASVNLTLGLLSNRDFCHSLVKTVERVGLDPSWLTIEITETEAMSDIATVIENAARIRMLGFNLSIDDFGTAYSSFSHLMQIPFSELKIERAFVSGMGGDATKEALVGACATIGARLGLHVVAEGVETPSELAAVRAAGCTEIQGFLVSRPRPAEDALAWMRDLPDMRFELPEA